MELIYAYIGICQHELATPRRRSVPSIDPRPVAEERPTMHRVRQQDLPFRGSSHEFVGADHGEVNVSVFLLSALPGRGPGPHRHPYDEVQFVREGRGLWTVNGEEFEAGAGDILVIKAGEIHSFRCIGDAPLVQLDVHLSPRFIQENLA
jgi:quercetin dioxygenase-like cupin family protein